MKPCQVVRDGLKGLFGCGIQCMHAVVYVRKSRSRCATLAFPSGQTGFLAASERLYRDAGKSVSHDRDGALRVMIV